jgi:hypothetical protein
MMILLADYQINYDGLFFVAVFSLWKTFWASNPSRQQATKPLASR